MIKVLYTVLVVMYNIAATHQISVSLQLELDYRYILQVVQSEKLVQWTSGR